MEIDKLQLKDKEPPSLAEIRARLEAVEVEIFDAIKDRLSETMPNESYLQQKLDPFDTVTGVINSSEIMDWRKETRC